MTEHVTNDQKQNRKVVGRRVDAKEYNVLKQYADILQSADSRSCDKKPEDCLKRPILVAGLEKLHTHTHYFFYRFFEVFAVSN
jgi:hypothetical protein